MTSSPIGPPGAPPVVVTPEVADALRAGAPVVALETTVITHGLPAELGVSTAVELEAVVRREGAIPATIGVLAGRVRVGLDPAEIDALGRSSDALKLNPGNLAAVVAGAGTGSTTVAATAWIASGAGIRVLATGGIGGVHRGESSDESADLAALARFPVAVVCSGAKAVLDLARTRERLETLGVPVLGLRTSELPAFYRRSSGIPVDSECPSEGAAAAALWTHSSLGGAGAVIANPVPAEQEMPAEIYREAIDSALEAARREGISGRAVTPFLLGRLRERSGGADLAANLALLRDNAAVAARVAIALSRLPVGSSPGMQA